MEVMIVVALVGIIAAFAMPNFTYSIANNRVKTVASDLHTSLLMIRSEAIKRNGNVMIGPITGGWRIYYMDGTDEIVVYQKDDVPGDVIVGCNYDSDDDLETCADVTFRRTGRPGTFLELRVTSTSALAIPMRCVETSLSGRASVILDSDGDTTNGCN